MSTRKLILVIVALLLLSVALTACGGTGSTSTSPAAQALLDSAKSKDAKEVAARAAATTVSDAVSATTLAVGTAKFTVADMAAMTQTTASTPDGDVSGVSLKAVLEAAGITAETISLVASDGYSADVTVGEIDDTAVLALVDGKINAIIPTVDKSAWVKDVVTISAK